MANNPVEDMLVKPSAIVSIYELEKKLRLYGLTTKDYLLLVQSRTKPKLTLAQIANTLNAAKKLERTLKLDKGVLF